MLCVSPATRKQECLPGTYSQGGATQCLNCNPGYRCDMGSTSPTPADGICDAGGYCDGLYFYPCPSGTFNPYNGSIDEGSCQACPPGILSVAVSLITYQLHVIFHFQFMHNACFLYAGQSTPV